MPRLATSLRRRCARVRPGARPDRARVSSAWSEPTRSRSRSRGCSSTRSTRCATLPPAGRARHRRARRARDHRVSPSCRRVIRTWSRIFIFDAGRNVEYGLRRDLFAHLTRLDPAFYRRHPTGDVMSRLTNDLGAVRMLFGPGLLNLLNTALVYATGAGADAAAVAAAHAAGPRPLPAAAAAARLRQPPHLPRQPRHPGAAGDDVDRDPGGPGRASASSSTTALEAARQRAFRAVNDEYLDAVAGAGAGARRADAAVRDAGRRRDADRPVGGRARGDRRAA